MIVPGLQYFYTYVLPLFTSSPAPSLVVSNHVPIYLEHEGYGVKYFVANGPHRCTKPSTKTRIAWVTTINFAATICLSDLQSPMPWYCTKSEGCNLLRDLKNRKTLPVFYKL